MRRIDLNGMWLFKAIDRYRCLPRENHNLTRWMEARVPSTVHTDLLMRGKIPDPFFGTFENEVQWVESVCWVYRKEFTISGEFRGERAIDLVAEGLDTYARITCNGRLVGEAANMFHEHRFDVRRFLKHGKNILEILFDSPTFRSKQLEKKHGTLRVALEPHRVYVRKAQYSFGWDWGPKLTTSGIWRDIYIEAHSGSRLRFPRIKVLRVSKREALVEVSVEIKRLGGGNLQLQTHIGGHGIDATSTAKIAGGTIVTRIRIPGPKLWWPNGYGDQPLYEGTLRLLHDDDELDSVTVSFGIRTVRLIQEKDAAGSSFVLEVNGERIFCKGANWIPADSFVPRVPASTYETMLRMAKNMHMNMIRVWGGGIYEQEVFYHLCDRLGLMVWQDFMFACGEYPETPWFLDNVKHEAECLIKRLRNHPSIVLWCGNNECEWLFCTENPGKKPDDMRGARIFRLMLRDACRKHDGTRPYWRSSPFGKDFPNAESSGNHHQWNVWSGWQDYKAYSGIRARFVTEFGFQAAASARTLELVTDASDRHPQSEVMEHRNKQVEGTERLFRFQAAHHRLGTDLDEFIYKSQIVQAEALKFAVEHWRRRKFGTAGTLFWQLNDCWPVTSWSVVDYGGRPKAAYFFAKRFFAPVLVSFKENGSHIEIWVTNDFLNSIRGKLDVVLRSFAGNDINKHASEVLVRANRSTRVHRILKDERLGFDIKSHYLHARLTVDGHVASENRFFFTEPKHLVLGVPHVKKDIERLADKSFQLALTADVFVKSVWLDVYGEDTEVDDNWFDLDAGETRCVRLASDLTLDRLRESIRMKWL